MDDWPRFAPWIWRVDRGRITPMLFTTPVFVGFLLMVYLAHWSLPRRWQNGVILISSLIFYGWWDWSYLVLLMIIAGADFLFARQIDCEPRQWMRKALLIGSLVSDLGILIYFKYFSFLANTLRDFGLGIAKFEDLILPIGISFYTFQALSYTIDVYRRRLPAVSRFDQYLCFITFFPHMVAGPIQQAVHLLVQFEKPRELNLDLAKDGLRQMLWGFFKKMVVADQLAPFVDQIYAVPGAHSGPTLLVATYAFAIQIYCDFSGYTDIALGVSKLFGIELTRNFAYPYFSQNIQEFWRRWHIALSTWFREYLYIPLGGNRLGSLRTQFNIFLTFLASGFWHGANWTFLAWGAMHGAGFLLRSLTHERLPFLQKLAATKLGKVWSVVITFHFVCAAWVLFRSRSLQETWEIWTRILTVSGELSLPETSAIVAGILMLLVEFFNRRQPHALAEPPKKTWQRWAVYYFILFAIVFYSNIKATPFIYFQF